MSNPQIPGLRRKRVQVHVREDFVRLEWFLVINLADLTDAVVSGHPVGGGSTKDFWTVDQLGALLYGASLWDALTDEQKASNERKLLDYLKQFEQNKAPLEHARTKSGFKSRYTSESKGVQPTLLWFPETISRAAPLLTTRYSELAANRTYRVFYPDTDFEVALSSFHSAYIEPVVKANEKLNAQLAPLREGVERLEFLHQVVSAMLDFAAPPAERKKLWMVTKPWVNSPYAYEVGFACNPNATEIANAKSLRDVTIPGLTQAAAAALEWRTNGIAAAGHAGTADLVLARERNKLAMELLQALRTNKIILLLLEEHENVVPTIWNVLEELLVAAFAQLATAPPALEELLASEFTAIARVAVSSDFDTGLCVPRGEKAKRILSEIESFVPETELVEKATDLSKSLINLRKGVDVFRASGSAFHRLWVIATPRMLPLFRSVARSHAYVIRAIVRDANRLAYGTAAAKANALHLQKYLDFAYSENPNELNEFLDGVLERTKKSRLVGAAGWSGAKFLLSAAGLGLALGELKGDLSDRNASASLAVAINLVNTSRGAADFIGATLEAAPYLQGRLRTAHETYSKLTTVAAKQVGSSLSMLDPVSATLMFAGAALAYGEANTAYLKAKRLKGDAAKEGEVADQKREQAVLALAGVGLAVASLALMTPLPIAGAVLALGSLALDRGNWRSITKISNLPGPGQIGRDTFDHLTSKEFDDAIQYVPNRAEIKTRIESLRGFVTEPFQAGTGAFWRIGTGDTLGSVARDILLDQYGFPTNLGYLLAGPG